MKVFRKPTSVSYLFSAMLHAALLATILWSAAPVWVQTTVSEPSVQTTLSDRTIEQTEDAAAWEAGGLSDTATAPASTDRTSVESSPSADSPGLDEFARKRLEWARRTAEENSPVEQLDELESLARRLSQVSSEESVEELSGTLSKWLGASERATQPSTAADHSGGDFDVGSAQVSDVKQAESETGMKYVAILVDAQGNSMETLLDDADGARLYKTFQLMKKFPFLETVYRKAVMGLLDKLTTQPPETVESELEPQPHADRQ